MDSLKIYEITTNLNGNYITVVVKPDEEFLYYIPDNLSIEPFFESRFNRMRQSSVTINKNWIWKVKPKTIKGYRPFFPYL